MNWSSALTREATSLVGESNALKTAANTIAASVERYNGSSTLLRERKLTDRDTMMGLLIAEGPRKDIFIPTLFLRTTAVTMKQYLEVILYLERL